MASRHTLYQRSKKSRGNSKSQINSGDEEATHDYKFDDQEQQGKMHSFVYLILENELTHEMEALRLSSR
jgi:hypothetical protein